MRNVAMLFVVTVLLVMPVGAIAQDAPTPPAGTTTVGQPVTIYSSDGIESAQVTIIDVVDPFEEWGEYYAPQIDERYAVVTVQIENSGERPFSFAPYDFQVLDTFGRLYSGFGYFRSEAAVAAMPDLEETSMLPGEAVTGALSYTVPVDAEVAQLVYMFFGDQQQHLYLLADLRQPPSG